MGVGAPVQAPVEQVSVAPTLASPETSGALVLTGPLPGMATLLELGFSVEPPLLVAVTAQDHLQVRAALGDGGIDESRRRTIASSGRLSK